MANKTRSFSEASREAGIPEHVDREFIASLGPVTWLSASPSTARNPQTGEKGDGLLATVETDDGIRYTTFIGNVVLMRMLGTLELPFRARLEKSGQAWTFAD